MTAYFFVLVARIIFSWIPVSSESVMATIQGLVFALTEPILGPLRRVIPPIGGGGMAFDLSPLIVFLALSLITNAFGCRGIF
ncbi:MAG: YggT family protein [Actinomycetota bacterium]|nr:YggT family protein [Actinomycetota bacterium]